VALSEKNVGLFSDLLLHDMGALGDGIAQGTAGVARCARRRCGDSAAADRLLHDGGRTRWMRRSAHEGEGANARNEYNAASAADRAALLAFLNTL